MPEGQVREKALNYSLIRPPATFSLREKVE